MGQQYFLFEVSEFVLFMLFSILYLIFTYKDQQKCANLFIIFYVLVHFLILHHQYFYTVKFAMLSNIFYCQNVIVRTADHSSEHIYIYIYIFTFSSTVYYAVL